MTSVRQTKMMNRERSTAAWADEQTEQRLSVNLQLPPLRDRAHAGTDDAVHSINPERERSISARHLSQTSSSTQVIAENNLMVWGIGGRFESMAALRTVFSQFGKVKDAVSDVYNDHLHFAT